MAFVHRKGLNPTKQTPGLALGLLTGMTCSSPIPRKRSARPARGENGAGGGQVGDVRKMVTRVCYLLPSRGTTVAENSLSNISQHFLLRIAASC